MPLLSLAATHPKLRKMADELRIEALILHLAPASLSGHNVCPFATAGCAAACLNTSGRGQTNGIQRARIAKTRALFADRDAFLAQLAREIRTLELRARRKGYTPAVRLNGTSDLIWERVRVGEHASLMELFPGVQFYDYTAIPRRWPTPNYSLTFSLKEGNDAQALRWLGVGGNVAVVMNHHGNVPAFWSDFPVIDGDLNDYRFLDPKGGYIVALKAKGKAIGDTSGFVRGVNDRLDGSRTQVLAAQAA